MGHCAKGSFNPEMGGSKAEGGEGMSENGGGAR